MIQNEETWRLHLTGRGDGGLAALQEGGKESLEKVLGDLNRWKWIDTS